MSATKYHIQQQKNFFNPEIDFFLSKLTK